MANIKSKQLSPESLARAQRQRLAFEDGTKAMAEAEKKAITARQNMQRLRALREAKEMLEKSEPVTPKRKKVAKKHLASRSR